MGRWQSSLSNRPKEKIAKSARDEADETDKTTAGEVPSVSSGCHLSLFQKFSGARKPRVGETPPPPAPFSGALPVVYREDWARLGQGKPEVVSEDDWRRALEDGCAFLRQWGDYAALWGWAATELFDPPREENPGGLVWQIGGKTVEAFGPLHARLSDERIIERDKAPME
jgi:hypothetical protein